MSKVKECAIIRCLSFKERERRLLDTLQAQFGVGNVYVACDTPTETSHPALLDLGDFIRQHQLFVAIDKLGWRCGDHCFYAAYQSDSNYDYYWLIENDVYVDTEALEKLLAESRCRGEDLLIHNFKPLPSNATWAKHYQHYYDEPAYGGFFPLVRLSNRAVGFLQSERINLAQRYDGSRFYPNDEAFVCGRLANNGFSCGSINLTKLGKYNLTRKLEKHTEKGLLHHPVYDDMDEVVAKEKRFIRKNFYRLRWGRLYRSLKAIYTENNGDKQLIVRHLISIFI